MVGSRGKRAGRFFRHLPTTRRVSAFLAFVFFGISVFVYRAFTPFTLLPVGVTLDFGIYAILGPLGTDRQIPAVADPRLPGVLTVGFFLALTAAILSLQNGYYTKPVPFYLGTAAAAGLLVARILLTDAHVTNGLWAFVLGVTTFTTNQIVMPFGQTGPDSGFHRSFARQIYDTSHIPGGYQYTGFPLQHVLSANVAHFSGLDVALAYRATAIGAMLLVLPLIYLVARRLGSREFALLAVVIATSMEYVIYRAGYPSKLAYALPMLMLTFVGTIYVAHRRSMPGMVILWALFATAMVYTHAHTAFTAGIMMVALAAGVWLVPFVRRLIDRLNPGSVRIARTDGSRPAFDTLLEDLETARASRLHMFAVLFAVVYLTHTLYFAGFYGNMLDILSRWVEVILLQDDTVVKETAGINALPTETLILNTVGSGLLIVFVVLGGLDHFQQWRRYTLVIGTWLVAAGLLMIVGVIGDAPFALPNRIYVMAQLTVMVFLAAGGVLYLARRLTFPERSTAQTSVLIVCGIVALFVFFSTASTIAGPSTSPFNDGVYYRMWTGMVEQEAADEFADGKIDEDLYVAAQSFPVDDNARLQYDDAEPGSVVYVNEHTLQTGVRLKAGYGQIGTSVWGIPERPRAGLAERSDRTYDNGPVELYRVREADRPADS